MDIENAFKEYQTSKENLVFPSPSTYTNLLSLAAGFGDQGSGCNSVRAGEPPSNYDAAFQIFTDMKSKSIKLTESCYTAMIRCFCINEKKTEALELYYGMKQDLNEINNQLEISTSTQIPKLRTYYPLLKLYSSLHDTKVCFYLYDEIRKIYKIIPTEREYNCMLKVTVSTHDDRFYEIIEDMIEDVFVPSCETWDIIKSWFQECNHQKNRNIEWKIQLSQVDDDGIVVINQQQLLSMDLDEKTRFSLLDQIEQLATSDDARISERSAEQPNEMSSDEPQSTFNNDHNTTTNNTTVHNNNNTNNEINPNNKKYRKSRNAICPEVRREVFVNFKDWLLSITNNIAAAVNSQINNTTNNIAATMKSVTNTTINNTSTMNSLRANSTMNLLTTNKKIDVLIDGANVGYFKKNYIGASSSVDYKQIDWMFQCLLNRGYQPLIILHSRHFDTKRLKLSIEQLQIIENWKNTSSLYITPAGCNDDWYWLYCTVYFNCKVVSNDEMRDHHFQMLSPR